MNLPDEMREKEIFNLRPEQISVQMFVDLVQEIEAIED
jgi:16S rRNA (adenine1518-N6/adenine1519-N6)-dimethyltransferase